MNGYRSSAKLQLSRLCPAAPIIHGYMDGTDVIHIGRIDFRNDNRLFGIKHEDRFSHVYIIGKTGTGKSTLIETMALQDLERGNGFALVDPHGDLIARIAARIPASEQDRVIYLNTTDPAQPYGYNPLRHVAEDRIALAASAAIGRRRPSRRLGLGGLRGVAESDREPTSCEREPTRPNAVRTRANAT
jgi:hypothetical protein